MCFGFDGDGALRESLEKKGMSRRGVFSAIGLTAGAAGLASVPGLAPAAAAAAPAKAEQGGGTVPKNKISIQLYSLRSVMTGDGINETLSALGEIGYPRVELAGLYGRTAKEMRRTLDRRGLRASSSHDGISASRQELATKLDNAEILGQKYMVVPYLNSDLREDWQRWAEQMNVEAEAARRRGIAYGYHNHAHEFTTDFGDGTTPWDVLTSELDPRFVHLEVDLYWAVTGGINLGLNPANATTFAIGVIHQAPQKVRQYHVKDRDAATGDMADLGTGVIDFRPIFASHQVEEYIVENDTPDVTPLQTADVGYSYLRRVRF
ncbi:sugar phosphate isomerase/epimerase family protein [Nocardioides insulae]|uniref:sugar phosphate isomerase/epimerase family protein n=1 Tax=Nocardioides insulae TaxID=394734 RepID=UPI0004024D2A|nr:sugar phosphate isomerase/epimerase [Nocardioides insulae]